MRRILLAACFLALAPAATAQSADPPVEPDGLTVDPPAPEAVQPAAGPTSIQISPDQPVAGVPAMLTLDQPAELVVITYRPNSAIPQTDTLNTRGSPFTPVTFRQAGVVRVAVPGGPSANVSVRFDRTPLAGVGVLLFAGLVLFGGAGFAMAKLLEGGTKLNRQPVKRHPDL